jgi:NADPH-dependent 2,4-dienoyl-CoA reductase/sulfur reductase-like enzyme
MLAAAIRTYINRFGVAPGRKIALFTTTDDGWKTASDLSKAGVEVEAVIDARPDAIAPKDICVGRTWIGAHVTDTIGSKELRGIMVRDRDGATTRLSVDTLAVSGGWNPSISLTTHLGPDALKSGSKAGAEVVRDIGSKTIETCNWRTGAKHPRGRSNDLPPSIYTDCDCRHVRRPSRQTLQPNPIHRGTCMGGGARSFLRHGG